LSIGLGVVILTMPTLVTVRKFRSSLTNAIFRWSTMENSGFDNAILRRHTVSKC